MDILPTREAAYAFEDRDAWLNRLALAVGPLLGDAGAVLFFNRVDEFVPRGFSATPNVRFLPLLWKQTLRCCILPSARAIIELPKCYALDMRDFGSIVGEGWFSDAEVAADLAAIDLESLHINAWTDPSGLRLATWSGAEKNRTTQDPELLSKIGVHLLAGLRLTERKHQKPVAWLTGDGRVIDAIGAATSNDALEALRTAAKNIDRARSKQTRLSEHERLDLWTGLVMGEWSLVDSFESDGRRLMIARQNDPKAAELQALSRQEAQTAAYLSLGYSQKCIAYSLGLSPATISTHVENLRRKLGLDSRVDLTAFLTSVLHHAK